MPGASSLRQKLREQPAGVYLLFSTELWERFSYYGMLGLLVLFMVAPVASGGLGWGNAEALRVFGLFLGTIWFAPLAGGWIADRLIGARRAVVLGCVGLAIGNFVLAAAAWTIPGPAKTAAFYGGLLFMIAGAGLFKSNVAVLMGGIFPRPDDPRRDFGFTLFYMGINMGALLAPLVAGTLGERAGWHWGFLVSGVGMIVGVGVFLLAQRKALGEIGLHSVRNIASTVIAATPEERRRIQTIGIFAVFSTIFAVGLMQYGGLLNLFTAQNIHRSVGGFQIPATWFLTLNPLYIILLGPLVASLWDRVGAQHSRASSTAKFAAGLMLMAVAFGVIAVAAAGSSPEARGHWLWIVAFYLIFTTGELCVYPVGYALVTRLAPLRWLGVLMGAWLLTNAVGSWIAGEIGALAQRVGNSYVFAGLAVIAAAAATLLWLSRRALERFARTVP